MIRRPPRSTPLYSSAASDVYKGQGVELLLLAQFFLARTLAHGHIDAARLPVADQLDRAGGALRGVGDEIGFLLYTSPSPRD